MRNARRVDPRARGGARVRAHELPGVQGRSPRTRGSRRLPAPDGPETRSIPAHAGEPRSRPTCREATGVDPRARGGAPAPANAVVTSAGRSPRTRGSRGSGYCYYDPDGSIPAHAGEPFRAWRHFIRLRVDPRARGGARQAPYNVDSDEGRSPRTRGSQGPPTTPLLSPGSIPAHAGEPLPGAQAAHHRRVHPRARGGAQPWAATGTSPWGPSPRTRGSPVRPRLGPR